METMERREGHFCVYSAKIIIKGRVFSKNHMGCVFSKLGLRT